MGQPQRSIIQLNPTSVQPLSLNVGTAVGLSQYGDMVIRGQTADTSTAVAIGTNPTAAVLGTASLLAITPNLSGGNAVYAQVPSCSPYGRTFLVDNANGNGQAFRDLYNALYGFRGLNTSSSGYYRPSARRS